MTIGTVLSLLTAHGFLSPKAARLDFLGAGKLVFMGAMPYGKHEYIKHIDSSHPRGWIAPFARRNYYHAAVLEMKKIISMLCDELPIQKRDTTIFCNSNLPEKPMAVTCGVGAYGKNSLVLVPGTGSLCILAGFTLPVSPFPDSENIETQLPLLSIEEETIVESGFPRCGSCTACISACPTDAIVTAGSIDKTRCIQHLTTCTEIIPEEIMEKWGFTIYGCQICQDICPENRSTATGFATHEGETDPSPPLEIFLTKKSDAIRRVIKNTVMDRTWIPLEALTRNALIAAGNYRQQQLLHVIEPFLTDSRGFIRETARWAYRKTTSTVS
jgi:epoxyqueuosine reductase